VSGPQRTRDRTTTWMKMSGAEGRFAGLNVNEGL
jgi:hypothetical protein